ncbi:tetratricopeptide repeat protein [Myroides indicus]|nr:tetratricopeptide repeat protein [Myroides indicus]
MMLKNVMGKFNEEYLGYMSQAANDTVLLTNHALDFIEKNDYSEAVNWYKAHALCMLAVQIGEYNEAFQQLYTQLNEDSNREFSSVYLNEEDYLQWFDDVVELNRLFISLGYTSAYVYMHELYMNARYGFKDETKATEYLNKGFEAGNPIAKAFVGYNTYYGNLGFNHSKEEGIRLLKEASVSENYRAEIFLLNIEFGESTSAEEGWSVLEKYDNLIHNQKRGLYVLADYYLREGQDAKALEVLNEGIMHKSGYCSYLLGMMICNGRFDNFGFSTEQGREYLQEGFERGIAYSKFLIGYFYLYPRDNSEPDFQKAIANFEKAAQYNSAEALLELALLYLYHKDFKNIALGMNYLDRAIAENYHRAMSEKGYALLDFEEVERNVEEGKSLLEQAMNLGNDYAPYRLGVGYQNAEFEAEADYLKAHELFEISAERNNINGLEQAGRYNRFGYAKEPNPKKAADYYQKAIELYDSNYCKVELAMLKESGYGIDKNIEEARELYESALQNNYSFAAIRLGFMYEDGVFGAKEPEKSREYFQIAADAEIGEGFYHLARCYRYGIGGKLEEEEAFILFKKALEYGFADANVDIALAYEEGSCGQEFDADKALEYMSAAAEAGIGYAQYKIGCYYTYGMLENSDIEVGKEWFEQASHNGSPLAMLALGDYYLYGYGQEKEYEKALPYYQMAEERNYLSEGIGICYQFGLGVEKDENKAFNYYKEAASRGYGAASFRLGLCYLYGNGTPEDTIEAFFHLREAADAGNMDAAGYVGKMLIKGEGTEPDPQQGAQYLKQSAEAGYADAQYELGNCYLKGEGVEQNDELAMQWYQTAAENGNENAQKIVGGSRKRRR